MGRPIEKRYFGPVLPGGSQIAASSWIAGDTQARLGHIVKQTGTNRYLVQNSFGEGFCELVDEITGPEQMLIQFVSDIESGIQSARKVTDGEVYTWQGGYYTGWNPVNGQLVYGSPTIGNYWLATYGDIDTDSSDYFAEGLVHDNEGNLIVCGAKTDSDATVLKLSPAGSLIWQKRLVKTGKVSAGECVAVDSSNNIYVAVQNWTDQSVSMIKLDSDGNILWQTQINQSNYIADIAVSSNGTSAIAVDYLFEQGTGVVVFNPNGTVKWQKYFGNVDNNFDWMGIGFVSATDLAVTSKYTNNLDDTQGFIVSRLDTDGNKVWTNTYQVSNDFNDISSVGSALDTDDNGNIYTQHPIANPGASGGIFSKFDSSGSLLWQKTVLGGFNPFALKAAADGSNFYSIGWEGESGIRVLGLSTSGELEWSNILNSDGYMSFWYSYGSRDVSIYGNTVAAAGYQGINGFDSQFQFAVSLRRDGTGQGIYGAYQYSEYPATVNTVTWSSGTVTVDLTVSTAAVNTDSFVVEANDDELNITNF